MSPFDLEAAGVPDNLPEEALTLLCEIVLALDRRPLLRATLRSDKQFASYFERAEDIRTRRETVAGGGVPFFPPKSRPPESHGERRGPL